MGDRGTLKTYTALVYIVNIARGAVMAGGQILHARAIPLPSNDWSMMFRVRITHFLGYHFLACFSPKIKASRVLTTVRVAQMMIDPDADIEGSFPDASAPGAHAPVRHWIAGNIEGVGLKKGDISSAFDVSAFHGPSPPAGSHRYGAQPAAATPAANIHG